VPSYVKRAARELTRRRAPHKTQHGGDDNNLPAAAGLWRIMAGRHRATAHLWNNGGGRRVSRGAPAAQGAPHSA